MALKIIKKETIPYENWRDIEYINNDDRPIYITRKNGEAFLCWVWELDANNNEEQSKIIFIRDRSTDKEKILNCKNYPVENIISFPDIESIERIVESN
jgi:hypothetical protein